MTVFGCGKEPSPPFQVFTLQPPICRVNQNAMKMKETPFMIANLKTARKETRCCRIIQFHKKDALRVVAKCIVPT